MRQSSHLTHWVATINKPVLPPYAPLTLTLDALAGQYAAVLLFHAVCTLLMGRVIRVFKGRLFVDSVFQCFFFANPREIFFVYVRMVNGNL